MNINSFPYEILSQILEEATKLEEHHGVTYTFGFSQAPLKSGDDKGPTQRYVRGPLPPDMLRWDATSSIRGACRLWHEWALEYALKDVYVRKWKTAERWSELPRRRASYQLYEMIEKPSCWPVHIDPLVALKKTVALLEQYPQAAEKVRRLWFHGFFTAETDLQIFSALKRCSNLVAVSLPWTTVRHLDAESWGRILSNSAGTGLESLELLAVDLPEPQARDAANRFDRQPFSSPLVDFGRLRRLKIFGDSAFMPICDRDLQAIARTATNLEEFHLTCLSSITIDGVMAVVKASQSTLRVLEHSPRSDDGFWHPHPGLLSTREHLCSVLTDCPRLRTVSLSMPSVCAHLFANRDVLWEGDFQVRAACLCGHEDVRTNDVRATETLAKLLHQARDLVSSRARSHFPTELSIELFFADFIFEPHLNCVHGDFEMAELITDGSWPDPAKRKQSTKGPYGSTGLYGKDEESIWERVDEKEFLGGVGRNLVSIAPVTTPP